MPPQNGQDRYVKLPDGRFLHIPANASPEEVSNLKQKLAQKYPEHAQGTKVAQATQPQGPKEFDLPGGTPRLQEAAKAGGPGAAGYRAPKSEELKNRMDPFNRQANEYLLGAASGTSGLKESQNPLTDTAKEALTPRFPSATELLLGPGAGSLVEGAYHTGKEILSPKQKGESDEDAAARRAHGLGSATGQVAQFAIPQGASEVRTASAPARAESLYERAVAPSGQGASAQVETTENFRRAAPYLAEQQRETPALNKQTEGPYAGKKMGVMNFRQNAEAAANRVWNEKVVPMTQTYERAPVDGARIEAQVRSTLNPNAYADATKSAAVNDIAQFHGRVQTVGEAMKQVEALNNDAQIQAYEKALPDKQAEMVGANPTLEAKLSARTALRDSVLGSTDRAGNHVPGAIETYGTPEEANYIRAARQDMSSILDVGKQLGGAKVPTDVGFGTRLANTARHSISPGFAREYVSRPVSTLFDLNNPNRLAAKSSRLLGESALQPREAPPVRTTPWAPPGPAYPSPAGPPSPTAPNVFARPALPAPAPGSPGRSTIVRGGGPGPVTGSGDVGAPVTARPTPPQPLGEQTPFGDVSNERGPVTPESLPPSLRWPQAPQPGPQVPSVGPPAQGVSFPEEGQMWNPNTKTYANTKNLWSPNPAEGGVEPGPLPTPAMSPEELADLKAQAGVSALTPEAAQKLVRGRQAPVNTGGTSPRGTSPEAAPSPSPAEVSDLSHQTGIPLSGAQAQEKLATRNALNFQAPADVQAPVAQPVQNMGGLQLPPDVQGIADQTGYGYMGSSEPFPGMKIHEFKHGATNRSVTLFDKDLNAQTLAQRIAEKNAQNFSGTMGQDQ